MIEALAGVLVGILTIALAKLIKGERWLYSLGLLTLPGAYVLFAFYAGERAVGVQEIIFGVPFILGGLVCAFISIRMSAVLVGVLWILHGVYDLTHGQLFINPGAPVWWPVYCAAVDVVIGLYLLWLSRQLLNADLRQAPSSK